MIFWSLWKKQPIEQIIENSQGITGKSFISQQTLWVLVAGEAQVKLIMLMVSVPLKGPTKPLAVLQLAQSDPQNWHTWTEYSFYKCISSMCAFLLRRVKIQYVAWKKAARPLTEWACWTARQRHNQGWEEYNSFIITQSDYEKNKCSLVLNKPLSGHLLANICQIIQIYFDEGSILCKFSLCFATVKPSVWP